MAIEVGSINVLSSALAVPSSFSDPLDNSVGAIANPQNLASVNNFNWVFSVLGWDSPFGNPSSFNSYGMGAVLSNGGGRGLSIQLSQTGANPPQTVCNGIIPALFLPVASALRSAFYAAKIKFIQFTINNAANGVPGVGLMNFEDATGTGAPSNQFAHDSYFLQFDGGLRRDNSGANFVQLHNGIGLVQSDVWRLSMDASNAAQTVLTVTRNGVVAYTVTDNNLNRLTGNAFPFIGVVNNGNAMLGEFKNFSCGPGL